MSKIWIYCLPPNRWNEMIRNCVCSFLGSFESSYDIKQDDIILIYNIGNKGEKTKKGFLCICQVASPIIKNQTDKIKVFDDLRLNKYILQIDIQLEFEKMIPIYDIFDEIKEDKTIESFRKKYLDDIFTYVKVEGYDNLIKVLKKYDNKNKKQIKRKKEKLEEEKQEKEEKIKQKEEKLEEKKLEKKQEKIKENDKELIVPILLEPCDKLTYDNVKQNIKFLTQHYKKCRKCKITNNNEFDMYGYMIGKVIRCKIDDNIEDDDKLLIAYATGQGYSEFRDTINVLYINNPSNFYYKCFIIY